MVSQYLETGKRASVFNGNQATPELLCQSTSRSGGEEKKVLHFLFADIGKVYLGKGDVCQRSTLNVILAEF